MDNYLITWFYAENKEDESFYPSVVGKTSSPEFQKVYWKCVFDFYKSAILTQVSDVKYLFYTNVPNIPTDIDGCDINKFFRENNIEVVRINLTNQTPKDWYGAWRNQFYLFDILEDLKQNYKGNFMILDSDFFIRKDLLPIFKEIEKNSLICYDDCIDDENVDINGITTKQMRALYYNYSGGAKQPSI